MKICKNCSTVHKTDAHKCTTCGMPGMLVEYSVEKKEIKTITIVSECHNCGTRDAGSGSKCKQCNFPLPYKAQVLNQPDQKVKTS